MKTKRFFAVVLTIVLAISAATIVRQTRATPKLNGQSKQSPATLKEDEIPDRIFYGEALSLLARLKNVHDYQDQAKLTDEEADFLRITAEQCAAFVRHCYLNYLRREPDPEVWDHWTNELNSDGNYFHILDGFQVSPEYRNRFCTGTGC